MFSLEQLDSIELPNGEFTPSFSDIYPDLEGGKIILVRELVAREIQAACGRPVDAQKITPAHAELWWDAVNANRSLAGPKSSLFHQVVNSPEIKEILQEL